MFQPWALRDSARTRLQRNAPPWQDGRWAQQRGVLERGHNRAGVLGQLVAVHRTVSVKLGRGKAEMGRE